MSNYKVVNYLNILQLSGNITTTSLLLDNIHLCIRVYFTHFITLHTSMIIITWEYLLELKQHLVEYEGR